MKADDFFLLWGIEEGREFLRPKPRSLTSGSSLAPLRRPAKYRENIRRQFCDSPPM